MAGEIKKRRFGIGEFSKHAAMIAVCAALFFPFLLMLQMSVKSQRQIIFELFAIRAPFHWDNYAKAYAEVIPLVGNSLIMAVASVVLAVFLSALAGYAFAKLNFPLKTFLFGIFFVKMLIPGVANLIPSYKLALNLGIIDTYLPVILFCAGTSQPFWVFVFRTFISGQPKELFESMRIDGAGEWRIFLRLAVPLMSAMVVLMSINVFTFIWNDYIWPLVTIPTNVDLYPITLGLARLTALYKGELGVLTAGYTIACIPLLILFMFSMRYFIDGLTSGSIKL
jgi:ABC-type glycerol-3-phosphate transport system permease component